MLVKLADGTVITVEADRDEIRVQLAPRGCGPCGASACLDIKTCEELTRALLAELKKATDW
jgi:hypothetical protein